MKTLANIKCSVVSGKLTIIADIIESQNGEFRFPVQQTTVPFINLLNPRWPRHVQISNEAVFVKASGCSFAIPLQGLIDIAASAEPRTSFPPVFNKQPKDLTAEISSELDPDLQWQVSDAIDKNEKWTDLVGQNTKTLDKAAVKKGQFVRLIASSEAGCMHSKPILIQ